MRTSGHGRGDGYMSAVPIAILVVFVLVIAGGFKPTLRTVELTLWRAVDWISALVS
jgi:hypothetical protein